MKTEKNVIYIRVYHDFLSPPRKGSHVKSEQTEPDRQTDRQADRHRQTQTDRHTHRDTHSLKIRIEAHTRDFQ